MKGNLKKTYQKPSLKAVSLVSEEAVLGNCKSTSSGASKGSAVKCKNTSCSTIGS
jgi:hypothetical protein